MSGRKTLSFNGFSMKLMQQVFRFSLVLMMFALIADASIFADQPSWIWTPKKTGIGGVNSQGECYFRKQFTLLRPEEAEMELTAGDEYEVYINGRLATRGQSYASKTKVDVIKYLEPGVNLIAAKVRHNDGQQVGLAIRFRVKEKGEARWRILMTDESWRTRVEPVSRWMSTGYDDMGWLKARIIATNVTPVPSVASAAQGAIAQPRASTMLRPIPKDETVQTTLPVPGQQSPAVPIAKGQVLTSNSLPLKTAKAPAKQAASIDEPTTSGVTAKPEIRKSLTKNGFEISPEFTVKQVFGDTETGSLIAMEFDEFGMLLLSREGGPLLIADQSKPVNDPGRVRVYCDSVTSCHGILALNGDVYVTANGPDGLGLYKLSDADRNGVLEVDQKLLGFTGQHGEYGPHGIRLGPDGMIYVVIGNGSRVEKPAEETSPYQYFYEGDVIPRYEDPSGHEADIKAPGGTIVRVSLDGSKVETVAGGIRNAYDLVFDYQGELFIHDSDTESDIGTPWYRPSMVFHVPAGAEFGWRSGWSKFPKNVVDQTSPVCETGRGSPTGAVLYQHLQFPIRFQDTMFLADGSEGRILVLRTQPSGAGFAATTETFLSGQRLNIVDLAVGEEGALYFCTGGHGTAGGVYKVSWEGEIPAKVLEFESDLAKAIRQPQPNSAWGRQSIANLKITIGDKWNDLIEGVATEKRNSDKFRLRALQLMVFHGPVPSQKLLDNLAKDKSPEIRAKTARICGLKKGVACEKVLRTLITDSSPVVRRAASESFMRMGLAPELSGILPMLSSTDRIEALTARRLIERIPAKQWESEIFTTDDKQLFIHGSVALLTAEPTLDRAYQVLARGSKFMEGFVNDHDFVGLLRAMELALVRGEVAPSRVPGLAVRLGNEFPSGSSIINRELVRLLAYLEAGDLDGRLEAYVQNEDVSLDDKVHLGMYMQSVGTKLAPSTRLAIVDSLEKAGKFEGAGGNAKLYLQRAVTDLSKSITPDEIKIVLRNGHQWPNAVLAAFKKLPNKLDQETVQVVIDMDQAMVQTGTLDRAMSRLRLGVIGILARSGDQDSMNYLRQLWQRETDRRTDIVIGLAQQPGGENWSYLVSSLSVLDGLIGIEVMEKLAGVSRRPRDSQHYRDVILLGYRLRRDGTRATVRLLEHWSGEQRADSSGPWEATLDAWRDWFHQKWPDQEKIVAFKHSEKFGRYSVEQVLAAFDEIGPGNPKRGHVAFNAVQCSKCHQFENNGQGIGPDLSSLAQRISLREAIETTLDPSHVIPDRFESKTILTDDGNQFSGMVALQANGSYVVLQDDGKRMRIAAENVKEVKENFTSPMPEGLLDPLSITEINDLFTFLMPSKRQQTAGGAKENNSVSQAEVIPIR